MTRKICALLLAVVLILLAGPVQIIALGIANTEPTYSQMSEEELRVARAALTMDFANNAVDIANIDAELEKFGWETMSQTEVSQKLMNASGNTSVMSNANTVSPQVSLPNNTGVTWTTKRVVSNYNGQTYELQIIEGKPTAAVSDLYLDNEVAITLNQGYVADLNYIIMSKASDIAADYVIDELIGTKFEAAAELIHLGVSIYDMLNEAGAAVATTEAVEFSSVEHHYAMSSDMRLVFIKAQGSADYKQELIYCGTSILFSVSTVAKIDVDPSSVVRLVTKSVDYAEMLKSPYYDENALVYQTAKNYWEYRNGWIDLDQTSQPVYQRIGYIDLWTMIPKTGINLPPTYELQTPNVALSLPPEVTDYEYN